MSQLKKAVPKSTKLKKYRPLTVGDAQKSSGIKYNAPANWTLVKYLNQSGADPLGELLNRAEKTLAK